MELSPHTWVLPEHKIAYVAVAKNACTSIKWMLADLAGEDPRDIYRSHRAEVTRRMCIHDRGRWRHAKKPSDLTPGERSEIRTENGWFIFTVIRDPRVRVWSAWQSKFLQRDPIYMRMFADREWLPRLPASSVDVLEDFASFAKWLVAHPDDRILKDPHFAPQVSHLDRQSVPFTRVYDISELTSLVMDLNRHLETIGSSETVTLDKENDTSLPVTGEVFAGAVREQLESVYADDLERFGDKWDFDRTLSKRVSWSEDSLRSIATRAAMGERIRDLADEFWRQRRALRKRDEEIRELRATVEQLSEQQHEQTHDGPDPMVGSSDEHRSIDSSQGSTVGSVVARAAQRASRAARGRQRR